MPEPFEQESPAVPDPTAKPGHRAWDWRDFGACTAAAAMVLFLAHFALTWDRALIGLMVLIAGFALGHWVGRRSAGGDEGGDLVHGRWGYRLFLLGAVLSAAALLELIGASLFVWWPQEEGAEPRYEQFPWRMFVGGVLALVFGIAAARIGWRSSRVDVPETV